MSNLFDDSPSEDDSDRNKCSSEDKNKEDDEQSEMEMLSDFDDLLNDKDYVPNSCSEDSYQENNYTELKQISLNSTKQVKSSLPILYNKDNDSSVEMIEKEKNVGEEVKK